MTAAAERPIVVAMEPGTRFVGREVDTVELLGALPVDAPVVAAIRAAGVVTLIDPAPLSIVFLQMRELRARVAPWPRFDYAEVLWRVGALVEGVAAWIVVRAEFDHHVVGGLAARLIGYDVHRAAITITDDGGARRCATVAADGRLALTVTAGAEVTPPPSRPLLVDGGRRSLAWHEQARGPVRAATIALADRSLLTTIAGEGAQLDRALMYEGRDHACGVARRRPR